jgi:ferredoxin-thioredoxin reductase catalytic subunit
MKGKVHMGLKKKVDSKLLEEISLANLTIDDLTTALKQFEKLIEQFRKMVNSHVKKNKEVLKLNPDNKRVHHLLVGLARNKIDFGKHFCPCMVKRISGDPAENRKRVCPCNWHKRDIELDGHCECGMFVKS